jgi:hypothetical protein
MLAWLESSHLKIDRSSITLSIWRAGDLRSDAFCDAARRVCRNILSQNLRDKSVKLA